MREVDPIFNHISIVRFYWVYNHFFQSPFHCRAIPFLLLSQTHYWHLPLKNHLLKFPPLLSGSLTEIPFHVVSIRSRAFDGVQDFFGQVCPSLHVGPQQTGISDSLSSSSRRLFSDKSQATTTMIWSSGSEPGQKVVHMHVWNVVCSARPRSVR